MMVTHIGPPLARTGGPAGVLLQLKAGLAAVGTGDHIVRLPPVADVVTPSRPPLKERMLTPLRRLRRDLFGEPHYYRPDVEAMRRPGSEAAKALENVWQVHEAYGAAQIADARDADVVIVHDVPNAARMLDVRHPGQQVWMVVHPPMPVAVYHIWCWGVPEQDWRDVASFPDVRRYIDREVDVWKGVDRVFMATPDALDELVRVDKRFATAGNMLYGLTGAAAPRAAGQDTKNELRRKWGLPLDQPVGLFLGHALPYRGFDCLLAALERLPEPKVVPGMIAVAGPPVLKVPGHERLRALGPVSNVGDLLRAVDFFVNVNRFNLFDLSIIEAAEAALPLLLHATGGNRTFAALGAGTVMIDSLDASAIARGIETMLSLSNGERRTLGQRSRACYDAHLTVEHHARRHVSLYDHATAACVT